MIHDGHRSRFKPGMLVCGHNRYYNTGPHARDVRNHPSLKGSSRPSGGLYGPRLTSWGMIIACYIDVNQHITDYIFDYLILYRSEDSGDGMALGWFYETCLRHFSPDHRVLY